MRAEQKIVRHGNANGINIPRQMLIHLGWLPGDIVVVELLEDQQLLIRPRTARDLQPITSPRIVYGDAAAGK